MTPKQAKAEADELIARANRIAKAKLDAEGERRVKAKDATTQRHKALAQREHARVAALVARESILLAVGEDQLLGPKFAGKAEK